MTDTREALIKELRDIARENARDTGLSERTFPEWKAADMLEAQPAPGDAEREEAAKWIEELANNSVLLKDGSGMTLQPDAETRTALLHTAQLLRRSDPVVTHYGYLYFNPDTGIEWAPNHPIESGEVPDAQDVRPAGLKELHAEMEAAWHLLHEEREGHKQPLTKQDEDIIDEAWEQHKAALNVSQPGVK